TSVKQKNNIASDVIQEGFKNQFPCPFSMEQDDVYGRTQTLLFNVKTNKNPLSMHFSGNIIRKYHLSIMVLKTFSFFAIGT
nr:hypothetical protein [Erysipelotrichaceae bacterium]